VKKLIHTWYGKTIEFCGRNKVQKQQLAYWLMPIEMPTVVRVLG
jgi:hypothetical protein